MTTSRLRALRAAIHTFACSIGKLRWRPILQSGLVAAMLFVPGLSQTAAAATFAVTKTADTADGACDSDCSLREAVIAANTAPGADVISLPAGIYLYTRAGRDEDAALTGDLDILDDVVLTGAGATSTIIDAAGLDRGFTVFPGVNAEFLNLTIQNGSTLDVAGTTGSTGGAGIYNRAGVVYVGGSALTGNVDAGYGGAIYNAGDATTGLIGSVTVVDSLLTGNCAASGGAINSEGNLTLVAATVSKNGTNALCAASIGGGLSINGGDVRIEGSSITANSADEGGGLRNHGGTVHMVNSTVAHNHAQRGGGVHNRVDGFMNIINTTIAGNDASIEGGGIYGDNWGQIATRETVVELANAIVAQNTSPSGPDCFTASNAVDSPNSAIRSLGHNLIGNLTGCTIDLAPVDPALDGGDRTGDPGLGPYTDTGRAGGGHFPLLTTSQAVDAGGELHCQAMDQLGQPRPADGNGDGVPVCDIGAYELPGAVAPLPPVVKLLPPIYGPGGEVCLDASGSYDPDGTALTFTWDWGDGGRQQTTEPYLCHTYAAAGTYRVTITATDAAGQVASASVTITVGLTAPIADPGGPYVADVGATVRLDGSNSYDPDGFIVAYQWDLGDPLICGLVVPSPCEEPIMEVVFDTPGSYTVCLTVSDDAGLSSTGCTTVTINGTVPIAVPGGPYGGIAGVPLMLDASNSYDPDGGMIIDYNWDFGDGSTGSSATPTIEHVYASVGSYTAALIVTDDEGEVSAPASTTASITSAISACFTVTPSMPTAGEPVTFDASCSAGEIVSYTWDFGDGTTISGGPIIIRSFRQGVYTVTLCITDSSGTAECLSKTFTVMGAPPLANAGGPYTGAAGSAITFDGSGSTDLDGTIVAYNWELGDGTTAVGATVTHVYTSGGLYNVALVVIDNDGLTGSDQTTSDIAPSPQPQPPVAVLNGPSSGIAGEVLTFDGSASFDPDGSIVGYVWSVDDAGICGPTVDGSNCNGPILTYAFSTSGTHSVTLTVTDNDGLQGTASLSLLIEAVAQAPVANAGGPYSGARNEPVQFDGSGSIDPDGTIVSYRWDFGDGGAGSGATPIHTYDRKGTYTVTLTVIDNDGLAATDSTVADITAGGKGGGKPKK